MAQQTAVSWMIEQIELINFKASYDEHQMIDKIFEQAKQMEKEQIMTAWLSSDSDSMYEPKQLKEQAEQYYNETYKKQ